MLHSIFFLSDCRLTSILAAHHLPATTCFPDMATDNPKVRHRGAHVDADTVFSNYQVSAMRPMQLSLPMLLLSHAMCNSCRLLAACEGYLDSMWCQQMAGLRP
jgi:hypothetical protein